jgi:threonine/homoserine/homoserine lactone efflux protein
MELSLVTTMVLFLAQGLTLGLSAAATPGPFQAYLLSQALKNGWQRTLPASLAPLISDAPAISLVLLVLTQMPDWFLRSLRFVGGLFLIYLAYGAYRHFRKSPDTAAQIEEGSVRQSLFQAAVMNMLNPNPYIFWAAIGGPILLGAWSDAPPLGISFMVGFYGTMTAGCAALIILFASARHLGSRFVRILSGFSALALFLFGLYQLWSSFQLG